MFAIATKHNKKSSILIYQRNFNHTFRHEGDYSIDYVTSLLAHLFPTTQEHTWWLSSISMDEEPYY